MTEFYPATVGQHVFKTRLFSANFIVPSPHRPADLRVMFVVADETHRREKARAYRDDD